MSKATVEREGEKERALEKLKTEEGRREFMGRFEVRLTEYIQLIKQGGDFLVDEEVRDMKSTADAIRSQEPDVAEFIDQARKKVEDLLYKAKAERFVAN